MLSIDQLLDSWATMEKREGCEGLHGVLSFGGVVFPVRYLYSTREYSVNASHKS